MVLLALSLVFHVVLFTTVSDALNQHIVLFAMMLLEVLSQGAVRVLMGLLTAATPSSLCSDELLVNATRL